MGRNTALVAMLLTVALVAGACAGPTATDAPTQPPATDAPATDAPATDAPATDAPASPPPDGEGFLACMVSDTGGIDDRSFNQNGWEGMEQAEADFGIEARFLESTTAEDYARNINQHISDGCDIIITVGFLLGDDTRIAAEANPDQRFAIVDFAYEPALPNVEGLVYNTAEAAMLAGYASASWTRTKAMGTFGGINIGGPVTDFMDGFIAGANYWNEEQGDTVRVLGGRDPNDPSSGTFTGDFDSTDNARAVSVGMLQEGADVILPVGGPIGQGTFAAIEELDVEAVGLGVDVDWTRTVPEYADLMLTHILKRIDVSVYQAIARAINDTEPAPVFVSDLENGGVGLGEFHDYDDQISDEVKAGIEALRQAIIADEVAPSDYYSAP
ncbi:MAG TPA: BMP family ABC transporter substrate-binding protein [Candidatus Limnocylindria bacterium]|nr:BMP family ABC transporter substrate-binding protein [Candidatus Limnocylindria bacterium]